MIPGTKHERVLSSLIIKPFTQMKFGAYLIGISVTFMIIVGYLFVSAFEEQYMQVMEIFQITDPDLKWEVLTNEIFTRNLLYLGVFFLVYLFVSLFVVFKLTHRYYGPLVSIERFVNEITQGRYHARVVIRKGDELQELVLKLNQMAESLEKKYSQKS